MYSNNTSKEPAGQAGYVPYFYHAGLFARYLVPAVGSSRPSGNPTESWYDFLPEAPAARDFDRIQTIEQVIASGYFAVPQVDPVTAIISDKVHTARIGLDDVIGQIRHRYEIYQGNMYELNQAVCEVHNALFRQLAEHGLLVANERQQYSATKQVQKLYEFQWGERVNLWRDVSRLRLVLPENAEKYLAAYRKVSILKDDGGDAP